MKSSDFELLSAELTSETIESMIYEIRGQKAMLDFELAKIYGYETRYLNRQTNDNIRKFPEEFMFQLSEIEVKEIAKCKNFTSRKGFFSGQEGGVRKLSYAFTKQGICTLMTGLKGYIVTKQSTAHKWFVQIYALRYGFLTTFPQILDKHSPGTACAIL